MQYMYEDQVRLTASTVKTGVEGISDAELCLSMIGQELDGAYGVDTIANTAQLPASRDMIRGLSYDADCIFDAAQIAKGIWPLALLGTKRYEQYITYQSMIERRRGLATSIAEQLRRANVVDLSIVL